jgi:hypothetical protein
MRSRDFADSSGCRTFWSILAGRGPYGVRRGDIRRKRDAIESALLRVEGRGLPCGKFRDSDNPANFRRPQNLVLVFEDSENTRTQEFVLRWSPATGNVVTSILYPDFAAKTDIEATFAFPETVPN